MMDMLEQMEASAERWADKHVIGDSFICECGQQCKLDDGIVMSPNPYASPACRECARAAGSGGR